MRYLHLIETHLPIIDRHLADAVEAASIEHGFTVDEDRDVLHEIKTIWDTQIKPAIENGRLKVSRAISVASGTSIDTDRLGIYWSTFFNSAHPYWSKNPRRWVVLHALVDLSHVDWVDTFALHIMGGENEVRLFQSTPVKIIAVEWRSNSGSIIDHSADNLVGKTLTT